MPDLLGQPALVLFLVAAAAAPATVLAGWWRVRLATPVAALTTALAFAAALAGWRDPGQPVDLAWAPAWGLRFHLALDGLATLYALLATGVGLAVVIYAGAYLPRHLAHEGRPASDIVPFYGALLLFMGAMVGLALAQDALLLFVCWDLTAIASYLLIGFDRHRQAARQAALMAFVVTGTAAMALLVAVMLLRAQTGTFALEAMLTDVPAGRAATVAGLLVAVAGLAKSAQVPLHFWLPRAMAAPTPVSAYLHSAAMVAAGVFLLGRFHPLLARDARLLDGLIVIGAASMLVGGALALTRDGLKQTLAYSTVSQYGYVVVLLGIGGEKGALGAAVYVLAHGVAKSALFLTAGAVSEATGKSTLAETGGLARAMPLLAGGSGLAAAALAGLPPTVGFYKDEFFFAAARAHGGAMPALAVVGAALSLAYTLRFWRGVFLGPQRAAATPLPRRLVWPVAALGALALAGGVWATPWVALAAGAAETTSRVAVHAHVPAMLAASAEAAMAALAIGGGLALALTERWWRPAALAIARGGEVAGPERGFRQGLRALDRLSDRVYVVEARDLRSRVGSVLPSAAALVALGLAFAPREEIALVVGPLGRGDLLVALTIVLAALAALTATWRQDHLTLALVLSGVGFSLAVTYALLGAPDVALVAVLVETIFSLLFLGMLATLPRDVDPARVQATREDAPPPPAPRRARNLALAGVGGALAFVVAWVSLSHPDPATTVASEHIALAPLAHGKDVVTVILADFRGFDTMGEITVIAIAAIGLLALLRGRRGA